MYLFCEHLTYLPRNIAVLARIGRTQSKYYRQNHRTEGNEVSYPDQLAINICNRKVQNKVWSTAPFVNECNRLYLMQLSTRYYPECKN